jgi:chromosome segregation ATPase
MSTNKKEYMREYMQKVRKLGKVIHWREYSKRKQFKIEYLEKEVQSLKEDWLMCDAVCDQKEFKIRELNKQVKELKHELKHK